MTNETSADAAAALLRSGGAIAPPEVDEVVSVIRSGDQFLISPPPGTAQSGGAAEQLPAYFLGALVIEWGYDVEYQSAAQFRRWLQDNEATLASNAPQGIKYSGTYAVFAQSELSLGSYRTIWAFDSFDAMQSMDGHCGDDNSIFGRLVKELASFRDQRIGAGRSQQIYQPAARTQRI